MDVKLFANPPAQFRPVPFWSWNDKLEPERLKKQVAEFAASGMGGFFMHPRPGIRTAFLSDDYFAAVTASVESAKQSNLGAWLYDECSYPSGFAGGLVPSARPDLAQKWLICRVLTPDAATEREIARFVVTSSGYSKITADSVTASDGVILQFTVESHQGTAWLNGKPYVDLLHPDSGKVFLELAYEPYAQLYAQHFGAEIPGIFTDEPNIHPAAGGAVLPWTPDLPQAYQERYGDDLLEHLPELFLDVQNCTVTRYRFWRLVTDRFISAWMRPVYEWCDKHGLMFTGHLWEHVLAPTFSGSLMAPLEYMHIPGMDLLGRDVANVRLPQDAGFPAQMGNVHMVKVVTSVAHQLGRERVLSETYGGCGWDISFETQKRYAEWEYALGVNLLNQHLSHYSLRGYRKHDYPISFMDYQPWWEEYRLLGDYYGRLSYALSQGSYQAELLVLHPMASLWSDWRPAMPANVPKGGDSPSQQLRLLETTLDHLTKDLAAAGWGFDFGDDIIMERHAKVEVVDGKPYLRVGAMQYQSVIVPACSNLAANSLRLLEEFIAAGGVVWVLPPTPYLVDGAPTEHMGLVDKAKLVSTTTELLVGLAGLVANGDLTKKVSLSTSTATAPIYHIVRETEIGDIVFLANMGDVPHLGEKVKLSGQGPVERWDLNTGEVVELPVTSNANDVEVTLDFAATESHLLLQRRKTVQSTPQTQYQMPLFDNDFIVHDESVAEKPQADGKSTRHAANTSAIGRHVPNVVPEVRVLPNEWHYKRLDPNVFVMDRCSFRVNDEPWSELLFTQDVAYRLRQRYGLPTQPFRDIQPWAKHPSGPPVFAETITIRYAVQSQLQEYGNLALIVEDADAFSISVNGQQIKVTQGDGAADFWLDPAFGRIPIGHAWQDGANQIELQFQFHEDLPVEPAFLLGDFAVVGLDMLKPVLVPEKASLCGGSWTQQGYPFYVGRMAYSQCVTLGAEELQKSIWLECSDLPNVAAVNCNGQNLGLMAWQPYRVELTKSLRAGENTIELVVANSLHNALGPMHAATLPNIIGPPSYTYSSSWITRYRLSPDGMTSQARLLFA